MNWPVKGVLQKTLSVVPGGTWVNDRLQRSFGELRHFDDVVDRKVVDDWLVLAAHLRKLDRSPRGQVQGLKIAPAFSTYPPEQLCCTSIDFVARKVHHEC